MRVRSEGVSASLNTLEGSSVSDSSGWATSVPSLVVRKPKLDGVGEMLATISITSAIVISAPTTAASSPF